MIGRRGVRSTGSEGFRRDDLKPLRCAIEFVGEARPESSGGTIGSKSGRRAGGKARKSGATTTPSERRFSSQAIEFVSSDGSINS